MSHMNSSDTPPPPADAGPWTSVVLWVTSMAVGGEAVGRLPDGRVVFVAGALPGERVRIQIAEDRRRYARAVLEEVLEASPDRCSPPCRFVAAGCGGCGWQHVVPAAQLRLKVAMAADAVARIGRANGARVREGGALAPSAYRTTVRVGVGLGAPGRSAQAGFRAAHSHDLVFVDSCLVAHPWLSQMLSEGDFGKAREAVLRCGVASGDRLAVLAPTATAAHLPEGTVVVGLDEISPRSLRGRGRSRRSNSQDRCAGDRGGRRGLGGGLGCEPDFREPYFREQVAGAQLRVSARSFFQSGPAAAELVVAAVERALEGAAPGRMVDAYSGVGLFGAALGADRPVTMVESSASALLDAADNVPGAQLVRADVAGWSPVQASVVVADPPRGGLGAAAAKVLSRTGCRRLVLVSCDAGSMGRDVGLLLREGFELGHLEVLDLFPGTPHLETVAMLVR